MVVKTKAQIHDHVLDTFDNQDLTPLKEYFVVQISRDFFRVVDDRNEPIAYPKYLFEIIDPRLPSGWMYLESEAAGFIIGPVELVSERGFYVRFFDKDPDAIALFTKVYERMMNEENQIRNRN